MNSNKWIVLGIVLVAGFSGYFWLQNDEVSAPTAQKMEPIKKQKQVKKKDIEILYLDESDKQSSATDERQVDSLNSQPSNLNPKSSNLNSKTLTDNRQPSTSSQKSPLFTQKEEEVQKIIMEKGLQKVVPPNRQESAKPQRFSIYAKNSYDQIDEEKYRNLPPMVPTIITVTTPKGEKYSVVADSKIVQNNDKIYISKNDSNGNPQTLLEVPTHKDMDSNSETQNDEQSAQSSQKQENIKLIMPPAIGQ